MDKRTVDAFFESQLIKWPEVAKRYDDLKNMQVKRLDAEPMDELTVIYNPERVISVTADISTRESKPCPLCKQNRPLQQDMLNFENKYSILVNPYPIFSKHFTIVANEHIPQQIEGRFNDLIHLAKNLMGYTIYYNGPSAGASVPGHMHFQAAPKPELNMRLPSKIDVYREAHIARHGTAELILVNLPVSFLLTATDMDDALFLLNNLYASLEGDEKQMINVVAWYVIDTWFVSIYIRQKHRPGLYYCDPPEKLTVSPAAVEMEGTIVTVNQEDFDRIDKTLWIKILREMCISLERAYEIGARLRARNKPYQVRVGILEEQQINFNLLTPYLHDGKVVQGPQTVEYCKDKVLYQGKLYEELLFTPTGTEPARIEVSRVTIGKNFHWQEDQTQQFSGSWRVVPGDYMLAGINIIDIEEYLKSVISSEMSAHAPIELLKAHAIIARTWVIRMIEREPVDLFEILSKKLVWHEADEHDLYDVCADDHCQRYQGITRITNPAAEEAVRATRGLAITYQNEVIDARYSKCCGGITEKFGTAWGDEEHPYLIAVRDDTSNKVISLEWVNQNIDKWIAGNEPSWCNVTDPEVISAIMNDFDTKTTNFYRWAVTYTPEELRRIIYSKTQKDLGDIMIIEPLERGPSGRLWKIRIRGTRDSIIVGKELEIRRVLSATHLYSSAFTVELVHGDDGTVLQFVLHGAGWGHGVGLCQIGAANMAAHGHTYEEIIAHYYQETEIQKMYE